MRIFGVSIDNLNREDVLRRVEIFLNEPRFHRIATVNPEFLLLARENDEFKESLLASDVRLADGVGVVLAGLFSGEKVGRFAGADLVLDILHLAEEKGHSIFLAINKTGLSTYEEVRAVILKKYPNLKVNGLDLNPKILNPPFVISENIVFCNYGAPEQEYFVQNLGTVGLSGLAEVKQGIRLVMGVGGSFDYMTGKLKRAPRWMRAVGLEWLWRGILQPHRLKRIWNAVVVFPLCVLMQK